MKIGAIAVAAPWLIAKAMITGAAAVTHKVLNIDAKRKFITPMFVRSLMFNTLQLLHRLEARFLLPA